MSKKTPALHDFEKQAVDLTPSNVPVLDLKEISTPRGEVKVIGKKMHGQIQIVHEAGDPVASKLDVEQRKQRREDNKQMRKIRNLTRRRKAHGRP